MTIKEIRAGAFTLVKSQSHNLDLCIMDNFCRHECVMGSVARQVFGLSNNFPTVTAAGEILERMKPGYTRTLYILTAKFILRENDAGRFNSAWSALASFIDEDFLPTSYGTSEQE